MALTSPNTFYFFLIFVGILTLTHILLGFFVTRVNFHQSLNHETTQQNATKTKKIDIMACNISKLNPFDPSMMKSYWKPDETPTRCDQNAKFPPLFTTDFENNLIALKDSHDFGLQNCCYKQLSQHSNYRKFWESPECFPIKENVTKIPNLIEYIAVLCETTTNRHKSKRPKSPTQLAVKKLRVIDAFAFVQSKATKKTRKLRSNKRLKDFDRLNVVILGLDSLSHMHFLRSMPKTHEFLTQNLSAIGMNGYFKVGQNTLPNLIPMLTGLSEKEKRNCSRRVKYGSPECSYIWNKFADQNYWTSFWQSTPSVSSFESGSGFNGILTDYFPRPLEVFFSKNLEHIVRRGENPLCLGPRFALRVLLDNVEKMAWTMAQRSTRKQYFQFNWDNSMSHDKPSNAYMGDNLILSTLKFLKNNGFLNKTVFVLMSDHGFRNWHYVSGFRYTLQVRIESKMPLVYFALPDWFSKKHPKALKNLRNNMNRLTTPFDLHETLLDFLDTDKGISDHQIITRELKLKRDENFGNLSRGISLFLQIPLNRTCDLAGIPNQFCACRKNNPISINDTTVKFAAESYIQFLRRMLKSHLKCAPLDLHKIHSAEMILFDNRAITTTLLMNLVLETIPGNGIFDVIMKREKSGVDWNVESDTRVSHYADHSRCVSKIEVKQYCYCK